MSHKPATERGVAQGHTELATPVSLLVMKWSAPIQHPFHCWWWKTRSWPLYPYVSHLSHIPGTYEQFGLYSQECQECW